MEQAANLTELLVRQKIIAAVFIVLIFLLTIEFIRRRALKERYALLWLAASIVLIPLVLWYELLLKISKVLGIAYPPATILLTAIIFIILILFHFSVALSKTRRHEEKLLLRIAEQDERLDTLEREVARLRGNDPATGDAPESRGG
ncbi:MAG TPA: DUF2304 domain-containing protein [bacterium]|nr:DUF2304 domain-containing protein [bacterium]